MTYISKPWSFISFRLVWASLISVLSMVKTGALTGRPIMAYTISIKKKNIAATMHRKTLLPVRFLALKRAITGGKIINLAKIGEPALTSFVIWITYIRGMAIKDM